MEEKIASESCLLAKSTIFLNIEGKTNNITHFLLPPLAISCDFTTQSVPVPRRHTIHRTYIKHFTPLPSIEMKRGEISKHLLKLKKFSMTSFSFPAEAVSFFLRRYGFEQLLHFSLANATDRSVHTKTEKKISRHKVLLGLK